VNEFTGERVIPGHVSDDLWAEHISRYAFAERFAPGRRLLDLGCGTGYGAAELANVARSVIGIDVAADAVNYASAHYPQCRYVTASAAQIPFAPGSFDLITAFEVIEHLTDWRNLLRDARRVLAPGGVFVVSTPNRLYYAESRAEQGPNPFHHHEFEFAEFRDALAEFFPHVTIYLQNRLEAVAFYAADRYTTTEASIGASNGGPAEANFFIGICSLDGPTEIPALLYVPKATNLLREREHHIRLLEAELQQNQTWVRDLTSDRNRMLELHANLQKEFDHRGKWAEELQSHLKTAQDRIQQLQNELNELTEGYGRLVQSLEADNVAKTQWALDTEQRLGDELKQQTAELARAAKLLTAAEATVVERTAWARDLEEQLGTRNEELHLIRQSRWIRLGRKIGLGPRLDQNPERPAK
jgi:SAM-dependent methyltransferase